MQDITVAIQKLEKIDGEIHNLKAILKSKQEPLKLAGLWEDINITEQDIEEAKHSLFKATEDKEL